MKRLILVLILLLSSCSYSAYRNYKTHIFNKEQIDSVIKADHLPKVPWNYDVYMNDSSDTIYLLKYPYLYKVIRTPQN